MLKTKECKAAARQLLLGRYTTVIIAFLLTSIIPLLLIAAAVVTLGYTINGFSNQLVGGSMRWVITITGSVIFSLLLLLAVVTRWFMGMGRRKLIINICRGIEYHISDIFHPFRKGSNPWRVILFRIVRAFILFVVGTVIPGLASSIAFLANSVSLINDFGFYSLVPQYIVSAVCWLAAIYIFYMLYFTEFLLIDKPGMSLGEAMKESKRLMKRRKLRMFWVKNFSFIFWNFLKGICRPAALWINPYYMATETVMYLNAEGSLDRDSLINGGSGSFESFDGGAYESEAADVNGSGAEAAAPAAAEDAAGLTGAGIAAAGAQGTAAGPAAAQGTEAGPAAAQGTEAAEKPVSFEEAAAEAAIDVPTGPAEPSAEEVPAPAELSAEEVPAPAELSAEEVPAPAEPSAEEVPAPAEPEAAPPEATAGEA